MSEAKLALAAHPYVIAKITKMQSVAAIVPFLHRHETVIIRGFLRFIPRAALHFLAIFVNCKTPLAAGGLRDCVCVFRCHGFAFLSPAAQLPGGVCRVLGAICEQVNGVCDCLPLRLSRCCRER